MKWSAIKILAAVFAAAAACRPSAGLSAVPPAAGSVPVAAASGLEADSVAPAADTAACAVAPLVVRTARGRRWHRMGPRMIPRQFTAQYAGSIGVGALGVGWHYGRRDQWETDLMLGYLPRFHADRARVVFAAKERFVPWHLDVGRGWRVEPLTAGLFASSIFGPGFWIAEPSRYGGNYYRFTSRVRANIFLGQRVGLALPPRCRGGRRHSLSAYYELSSCDLYIVSAFPNRRIRLADVLSLAVGVRYAIF